MQYQYHTSFRPVTYEKEESGVWIFKKERLPVSPNPASLYDNEQYKRHLSEMGEQGWELINVQPLLRGLYQYERDNKSGFGLGYSLTAGYYFFWKKTLA
ncbi:MAG: hypothetical protein H6Q35_1382 [Proteobacteria bacterium]|nr:hypothetical protein [Pseudomonadota bacterium]